MGSEHNFGMVGRHTAEGMLDEFAVLAPREGHVLTGLVAELAVSTDTKPPPFVPKPSLLRIAY